MNISDLEREVTIRAVEQRNYDILIHADDLAHDWDLKHSWMTINNWRRVTRAYLDPSMLAAFYAGETNYLPSKGGHEVVAGRGSRRAWGACILGWSLDDRHTLHMHSRTSIAGFLLPLDLTIGRVLALGVGAEKLTLHLDYAQIHPFKSMPFFFKNPDILMPASMIQAKNKIEEMDEAGLKYLDMSFAQACRFRRRFHTELYGPDYGKPFEGGNRRNLSVSGKRANPLPSHPAESLNLAHLHTGGQR